jgi:hypothetical protein
LTSLGKADPRSQGAPRRRGGAQQPGAPESVALQAGLNALGGMFQAGVHVSPAHQQSLNEILQSVTGANRS